MMKIPSQSIRPMEAHALCNRTFDTSPETHDSFPQPLIIFRDKRLNTPATARVTIERVVCRKR